MIIIDLNLDWILSIGKGKSFTKPWVTHVSVVTRTKKTAIPNTFS